MQKKTDRFIERSLFSIVSFLKATVYHEHFALQKGYLQSLDPRFKSLGIVFLQCSALFSKNLQVLCVLYVLCVLLSRFSTINMRYFFQRTLLFVPLFSLCIALPALSSWVSPGESVAQISFFSYTLIITKQGIASASIFVIRVLVCVSLGVLLVLTTRQNILLKTLRIFGVSQLFVMTISMSYRYIYLLLDMVQNAFVAIKSRVGSIHSSKLGQRVAAVNMAGLWLRSYQMHSQIYDAMLSRGYSQEVRLFDELRIKPRDIVFLVVTVGVLISTLWLNRYLH